ncbi:hypothetical protein CSO01_25360 [Cellulomonas soli]|uniref:DUF222 domain-containing protein n=1 Tax=Cellulomonas soli TaxID=931535 RepID=A0A512PF34_9CELL|nr:hypothetical protein CSO01_25360 [Cellulomonas soli]
MSDSRQFLSSIPPTSAVHYELVSELARARDAAPGGALARLAADVLDGRVSLQDALRQGPLDAAVRESARQLGAAREALSREQLDRVRSGLGASDPHA